MIKFYVTLTHDDLKKFIFEKIEIKKLHFWFPVVMCFLIATFISIFNLWLNFGLIIWIVVVFLLCMSFLPIYKAIKIFRSMLANSVYLVGVRRKFFIDERSVYILSEHNSEFDDYSRYFFYDLQKFTQNAEYLFLTFFKKVYIIIPKRCLEKEQLKSLLLILKKI